MTGIGLVLMDVSLKPIAFNQKAAAILNYPDRSNTTQRMTCRVPKQIVERIRSNKSIEVSPLITNFQSGRREYICSAYFMDSYDECYVALLLERNASEDDVISEVAAQFNLTQREREVLKWISKGLGNKEVATAMNISPNTVKAFLRLMMMKMGVTTRSAVIAKIIRHKRNVSETRVKRRTYEEPLALAASAG